MKNQKGQNQNHPKKGSSIKVEPIRDKAAIKRIKKNLSDNPMYSALFCLGINCAFRAGDLLSIKVKQVRNLQTGGQLTVKEKKTGKSRTVNVNRNCVEAIQVLLASRDYQSEDYLFLGKRGVLTVSSLSNLVKKWCKEAGLGHNGENYSSHSLRKTWGFMQRTEFHASLPVLMRAYGHSSQNQTLTYLGIQEEEVQDLYANEI